jgi:hypothetical protein
MDRLKMILLKSLEYFLRNIQAILIFKFVLIVIKFKKLRDLVYKFFILGF